MSDPLYEFSKDLLVPGVSGLGALVVGAAALFVARKSNALAAQVRQDEQDRENAGAAERYRAQLIDVAESVMTALMEYGTYMNTSHEVETPSERNLRAIASTRLSFLRRVAQGDDRRIVEAMGGQLRTSTKTSTSWFVRTRVAGQLASAASFLVTEDRNLREVLEKINGFTDEAVQKHADSQGVESPPDELSRTS